jgi:hypothetical protein
VEVKAGELVRRLSESLYLCHSCADLLVSFVQSGKPHQTHQDAAGEALADMAVASIELTGEGA